MTEKIRGKPDKDRAARARGRASTRSLPQGPHVEVYLEGPRETTPRWEIEDPTGAPLDRGGARSVLARLSLGLVAVTRDEDEWIDETGRLRLLIGEERLLVRFTLIPETKEHLARELDRLFDICFELARELGLDVLDPQVGTVLTRFRYENQFPKILDAYFAKARTAAALQSTEGWEILGDEDSRPPIPVTVPGFESDPDSLPPAIWSTKVRRVGPIELRGDRALAVIGLLETEQPFFVILPPGAGAGEDAALLRALRISRPVPSLVIVDVVCEGVRRMGSVQRKGNEIEVRVAPSVVT